MRAGGRDDPDHVVEHRVIDPHRVGARLHREHALDVGERLETDAPEVGRIVVVVGFPPSPL